MAIEIERKFRVTGEGWRDQASHRERIAQGYLAGAQPIEAGLTACSVRVRISGEQAWINVKSATAGIARAEFEYPIPVNDAQAMLDTLAGGVLEKIRHHVTVDGSHFEVDEFLGANAGLILAEVELPREDAPYARPDWLGQDVSEEGRFYNIRLIERPFGQWTAAEQQGKEARTGSGGACL